jgi:CHAD domain-containing protein
MIEQLPPAPAALVRDFIEQRLVAINGTIAAGKYSNAEVHSVRKNLKDINYILAIYQDDLKMKIPFRFWADAEKKKADDMVQTLGSFNDRVTALSFLPIAKIRKADNTEKDHLVALRKQWLTDKRRLKKKIVEGLAALQLSIATVRKSDQAKD